MANLQGELDRALYSVTMDHLARLAQYIPGPVKKRGTRDKLHSAYRHDPVFSVFGLDSPEYLGATLAGGTITSIHRKIGDVYEACVKTIFMQTFGLSPTQITYSTIIRSGSENEQRSADVVLLFEHLNKRTGKKIAAYCAREVAKLASKPKITLIGIGFEVRHCYQTGDSKRTQADEAMARHLLLSGVLPVMPLFCNQSNPGIVNRYRSVWVVKQGLEAYDVVRKLSGYDFFDFLQRNRDDFRQPVIELLRSISTNATDAV